MSFLAPRSAVFASVFFLGACASNPGSEEGVNSTGGGAGSVGAAGGSAIPGSSSPLGGQGATGNVDGGGDVPTNGGSSGAATSAPTTGGHGSSLNACGSAEQSRGFEQDCLACAANSCEMCLCSDCTEQLEQCADTPGCPEILQCTRQSGCFGVACYCGDFDAVACVGGQSNGPCKDLILSAPGSRVPSVINPSAGPASDAAVAISTCAGMGQPCAEACGSR